MVTYAAYVQRSLAVARALNAGGCGGFYYEACLLAAALSSGLSAIAWPGEGQDKVRFVQAWATLADPRLTAVRISLPFLVRSLIEDERYQEVRQIEALRPDMLGPGDEDRVVTGDEVDADEGEILAACPSLPVKDVREQSYAALFYAYVRCVLVNEYALGAEAASRPMSRFSFDRVSYSNEMVGPGQSTRRIHFPFEWLAAVVGSVADHLDRPGETVPRAAPAKWWLHGG